MGFNSAFKGLMFRLIQ